MKVVWTEHACERLREIETFVARDSPVNAVKLIDGLIERGEALACHPDRGRTVPEIPGAGLRELIVGNYRMVYRHDSQVVEF